MQKWTTLIIPVQFTGVTLSNYAGKHGVKNPLQFGRNCFPETSALALGGHRKGELCGFHSCFGLQTLESQVWVEVVVQHVPAQALCQSYAHQG